MRSSSLAIAFRPLLLAHIYEKGIFNEINFSASAIKFFK